MKNNNTKKEVKQSAPWYGYVNEIKALFREDPDIKIYFDDDNLIVRLFVEGQEKAEALDKLLPDSIEFGNLALEIKVIPANQERLQSAEELFRKAFKDNPVVKHIETVGIMSNPLTYISFRKEVVQYYDDNLGDLYGNRSRLMEDIARHIFAENKDGIFFSTDIEE